MHPATVERSIAATGSAALLLGIIGAAFERGWPSGYDPIAVARFVRDNRGALLAQSMAFALSACAFIGFFAALQKLLERGARHDSVLSTLVSSCGTAWAVIQLAGQALQVGVALDPIGIAPPILLRMLGAVFAMANLPLALTLLSVAVVAFRTGAYPHWLNALALLAGCAEAALWVGGFLQRGALATTGWLTYVLYPTVTLWLVPTIVVTFRRSLRPKGLES